MTADKPPQLELPIRRMLELERAEKIVTALARGELPALTDAELEQIIAIAGEDAPLFDPDTLELDGWRRDHNRSWVPPDIHAIDASPVRSPDEPAPGAASGAIRNDELRERWAKDPENWIHRWDRRDDWIERWGGRQLP